LWSLQDHGNTILPLNEDNLLSNLYITTQKSWSQSVRYLEIPLYIIKLSSLCILNTTTKLATWLDCLAYDRNIDHFGDMEYCDVVITGVKVV